MQLAAQIGTIQRDSQKISLILNAQEHLDTTGLKVMQYVADDIGLIPGFQADYNDQIRVNYNISKYASLSSMLPRITSEQLFGIFDSLENVLRQIYNVGFLQYENISFEAEDIFLDVISYQVYLIYLPVKSQNGHMSQIKFENYFRDAISGMIGRLPADDKLLGLRQLLGTNMPLEDAFRTIRAGDFVPVVPEEPEPKEPEQKSGGLFKKLFGRKPRWILTGTDTPQAVTLVIEGDEYTVGKNPQMVQGVLEFSRTISRRHCKFIQEQGKCFLMDLGSANGTFVNGERLKPEERREVFSGDKIQLANSTFVIERR